MGYVIDTDAAPSSPFYSQCTRVGGHLHVSGLDVATGQLAVATIQAQTRQAIVNGRSAASSWSTTTMLIDGLRLALDVDSIEIVGVAATTAQAITVTDAS